MARPIHDSPDGPFQPGLLTPGGKVDEDALLAAIEQCGEGDDPSARTVEFLVRADLDSRLDKYLTGRITFLSRNQLQMLIDSGDVTVNGRPAKASSKVQAGTRIRVVVPPPPAKGTVPEDIPIEVMYEDEYILVMNKAPDIITHPARSHLSGTLINALAFHFQNRSRVGGSLSGVGGDIARPGVVHRLDRDTTGCMVFAKTDEAHWKLGHQFERRQVDKRYIALVHGIIEPVADTIDLPLGSHPNREKGYREKQVVRHDDQGRSALTLYRVREHYPGSALASGPGPGSASGPSAGVKWARETASGWAAAVPEHGAASGAPMPRKTGAGPNDYTLVELELKTGRTHQIRVHLSHFGWPIVGDDMYGGKPLEHAGRAIIARQALHAALLEIRHPITNEMMTFTAPVRGDMAEAIHHLRSREATPGVTQGTRVDLTKAIPPV